MKGRSRRLDYWRLFGDRSFASKYRRGRRGGIGVFRGFRLGGGLSRIVGFLDVVYWVSL